MGVPLPNIKRSPLLVALPGSGSIALFQSLGLLRRPRPQRFESFIGFPLPLGGHSHRRKLLQVRHQVPQAHVLSFRLLETVHQDRLKDQGGEQTVMTLGALSRIGYQGAMSGRTCDQELFSFL